MAFSLGALEKASEFCFLLNLCGFTRSGPEVKLFFVLNSAEHEIFSANKYENANNSWHFHIYWQRNFHAQLYFDSKKGFAIVSHLRFIIGTNFMLSCVQHGKKNFITSVPDVGIFA